MNKLWTGGTAAAAVLLLIQFVPYGRNHANPVVRLEPAWDRPATRDLARRTCFDCHSNETKWPWYASVAPVSWYLQHHVSEGRETLNFSDWSRVREAKDAVAAVVKAEMPPWSYKIAHREARLSAAERQALAAGIEATVKQSGGAASKPGAAAGERE